MTFKKISDMPGAPFQGYYNLKDLPVKRGDKVRIPKGTTLRSMNPAVGGPYLSKRAQTITVNHLIEGRTFKIANVDMDMDEGDRWHWCMTDRDIQEICKELGLSGTTAEMDAALKEIAVLVPHQFSGHYFEAQVAVGTPVVCWPGRGGYWVDADINVVELMTE